MPLDPAELIKTYGYWAVAIIVGLESIGIPLPGETMLIAAATYAGATHALDPITVVAAAATGAIVGDSIGFFIGREIGIHVLHRYGPRIGLDERRLKLGQYLFMRHGGKVVFFGRFVALLRTLAAMLAGANQMLWPRFLFFNAAGGMVWASIIGFGAYMFGDLVDRVAGPIGIVLLVIGIICAVTGFIVVRRHEQLWIERAERAIPGPIHSGSSSAAAERQRRIVGEK
jgi:membrane protein DedA with SNARE-associated domain